MGQLVRVRGQHWVVADVSTAALPGDELALQVLPGRTLATLTSVSEDDLGTAGVVAGLVDEASDELVLVNYATVPGDEIRAALGRAADRGVAVTLVLERAEDNAGFRPMGEPFPGLAARRLCWPATRRPPGAALHAKLLVVDRSVALVGSANLTGHGLDRNLECGLLVRGGPVPGRLVEHVLAAEGIGPVPA